jgi:hypothetical protein
MKKSLLMLSLMFAAVFAVAQNGPEVPPAESAPPTVVVTQDGVVVQPAAAESEASADCGKSFC